MINVTRTAFILSAERKELSDRENFFRTEELKQILNKHRLPFKEVQGNYEGSNENSIYVLAENTYENVIAELSKIFNQECYLKVYYDNHAELVYPDKVQPIGVFTQVKDKPEKNYTNILGTFFVCI